MQLALKQLVGKGIISLFALKLKLTKKLGMAFGINKVVGAIEKGKRAIMLVSKGDLLDIMHAYV
ncbi:hypothetical protein [Larkinella punicea]|uniref:Uncharacterized protein n=1 Tax=Larkinella punicea TaxID=2315727 RepID=A0A368JTE6_9BACT|nr:hypothetical protein [Larkinella punicea]RCR70722.1 hypothetical protein DUE52_03780 [Larkinella punicea]